VHLGDDATARILARRVNEYLADIKRDRPDRFGAFGALPLPDIDGSLDQIAYALDILELDRGRWQAFRRESGSGLPDVLTTDQERRGGNRSRPSALPPAMCRFAEEELAAMTPFDATHLAGPLPERRSRLDVDEPGAWHEAIALGSDLLVQRPRPIVADLVGPGRMGLGTLLASADPMVIVDVLCYRSESWPPESYIKRRPASKHRHRRQPRGLVC
jgi:hypothetical protein